MTLEDHIVGSGGPDTRFTNRICLYCNNNGFYESHSTQHGSGKKTKTIYTVGEWMFIVQMDNSRPYVSLHISIIYIYI